MGFSSKCLGLLIENKGIVSGKSVLSLGNPFIKRRSLDYLRYSQVKLRDIMSIEPKDRSAYFFKQILEVSDFEILDISAEEGASIIHNLNNPISGAISDRFDIILDLGTQEHIFNITVFYENLMMLMKDNALLIFDLPANGLLEHGFRQYSPTFFYDFCRANKGMLELNHLSLHMPSPSIWVNVIPLYWKLDAGEFSGSCRPTLSHTRMVELDSRLIGATINAFSRRSPVGILGAIRKSADRKLTFDVIQTTYRLNSLGDVLPSRAPQFSLKQLLLQLFHRAPFPMTFLIQVLFVFSFFLGLKFWVRAK